MTATLADFVASYINRHSDRFTADIQPFGEQTWVLLRDREPDLARRYIEPIVDLQSYLDREDRPNPLSPELRALLESALRA